MSDLAGLQKALGMSFNNPALLTRSLVHSSYCNENPAVAPESNERLEFLGDAILGFVVAERLYEESPALSEGEMTQMRATLVRRETLARMANRLNLGNYLFMGKGEEQSGGREKPANLASAFEGLIAAIYLDRGILQTRHIVLRLLDEELRDVVREGASVNYKSMLQEALQSMQKPPPSYVVVDETGPSHERVFTVEAVLENEVLGEGRGKSKKAAEMKAAQKALERLPRFTA